MPQDKRALTVTRSFIEGHVSVRIFLKGEVRVAGSTLLTSGQARVLAKELTDEADRTDAKVAERAAAKARREKWRDREIAAGRFRPLK